MVIVRMTSYMDNPSMNTLPYLYIIKYEKQIYSGLLLKRKYNVYLPVCICILILTKSTGHATTSCATPPAHPAKNILEYDGFSPPSRNHRRLLPQTPKKSELRVPVANSGKPIPLQKPRHYRMERKINIFIYTLHQHLYTNENQF